MPGIDKLNRSSNLIYMILNRITVDPEKCGGKPCIRGYRLRVKDVLELLAAGANEAEILQDYPFLEKEDIQACLDYAAHEVDVPTVCVS